MRGAIEPVRLPTQSMALKFLCQNPIDNFRDNSVPLLVWVSDVVKQGVGIIRKHRVIVDINILNPILIAERFSSENELTIFIRNISDDIFILGIQLLKNFLFIRRANSLTSQ